ncbi:MAG TPA: ubiquinone/menaquinone biosynthesis methyltransferase [Kouleothrix sp.]|uniref:ubiquinone/menaquinone biosynthesis methyltransferase n=1 Tax=Kouleothrix sp. TaxID=2779161 RepID=UPI002C8018AD|nr:ubiquinone/menaquinone biosynthesis methyltransferase [Kouleothrix sp.]HRC74177.1 ubiquinone/menaquinone biosynthesis methyltransferase [Kouleothrix sp.]
MSVLPPPDQKAVYVERMFARIAPSYDRMNRVMTIGMDRGWRDYAVNAIAPPVNGRALDVGTGTGDFLPLLASWMPQGFAVGLDFTVAMMQAGLPKLGAAAGRAGFVGGDALRLPFAEATFDAITTGFTMRNVVDIEQAFREMARVARPGCALVCLEVARPNNPLLRLGHRIYFEQIVPRITRLLGGDPTAYTYLPQSARAFPPPDTLVRIMQQAGWSEVRYALLGMGAVAVHTAFKQR